MAKERTIDELRQDKEYGYNPPHRTGDSSIVEKEFKKDISEIEDWIADKVCEDFKDQLFETVNEYMSEWDELQISNYINYDNRDLPNEILDAAYEWYHNIHGNIIGKIFKEFKI